MMQPRQLQPMRARLARLLHRRKRFRWATAGSALAIALLWALAAVFALDWCFQRNIDVGQRLVLLAIAAGAVTWAVARFARPWLGAREDETDMALIVQREANIDSDLVAALQFESPEAQGWGSPELETAVIERIAAGQENVDVMAAMPRQPLAFRLKVLVATLAVWAVLGVLAPRYVAVFFQRLAFGAQHYPTQTRLLAIRVNGTDVDLAASGAAPVRVPYGHPVRFEITAVGSLPAAGRVELVTQARGPAVAVPLVSTDGSADQSQRVYQGECARLNQSARYKVYLGDAWTELLELSAIPLPLVEVEAEVAPPAYARRTANEIRKLSRGLRQFPVLVGSEVRLNIHSDRPLKTAEATIGGKAFAMNRREQLAGGAEVWSLSAAGTPLASVAGELPYSIQVSDTEGQSLDEPLQGRITIEADLPPRITISTQTPVVLPGGSPVIHYEAADDHALSRIWLTWEAAGKEAERREGRIEIASFQPPATPRRRAGEFALPLASLSLAPGDTLKVTFHAGDYRGAAEAATTDSDPPLVFEVTDLHGFEASMYDADRKSAEVLENLRKHQTGELQ